MSTVLRLRNPDADNGNTRVTENVYTLLYFITNEVKKIRTLTKIAIVPH